MGDLGSWIPDGVGDGLPDGLTVDVVGVLTLVGLSRRWWPTRDALVWMFRQDWYSRDRLPWRRARLAFELRRRAVHARAPLYGNPLQMLKENRLRVGPRTLLAPGVTVSGGAAARIVIGADVLLQRNVTIGAEQLVAIGDDCLIAQGCYITDADHATRDPDIPIGQQGMRVKGATVIEDNVWLGANVVVTSGVRIGRRSVVGANTVVNRDVPPGSLVHGSSAIIRPPLVVVRPAAGYAHPAHPNGAKAGGSAEAAASASTDSVATDALRPGATS